MHLKLSHATGIGLVAVLLLVGACREAEQDRPTEYLPGIYQGKADPPPSTATMDRLRDRVAMQAGVDSVDISGNHHRRGDDVRPPDSQYQLRLGQGGDQAQRDRVRYQGGR